MSARGQAADPSASNMEAILEAAFAVEYEKLAGQDPKKYPFLADFDGCNSPDAALDVFRKQAPVLDGSNGGKLLKSLTPVVNILSKFSETLGEGIGLLFGPTKAIFTGIAVLLEAVKDVAASHDTLVELFERIELFLSRLKLHNKSLMVTMAELLGKILAHILFVLTLTTKEMKRPLFAKSFKMLTGRKDIGDALQRLDMLINEEALMTAVITLDKVNQTNWDLLQGNIKNWLSPPDCSISHHTAREKQHDGTAEWFIEDSRFRTWKVNGSLLWICGNPGSGKTVLCSAIIENIKQMQRDSPLIAYHYFDFGDDAKHNLRGLLSSFLFQLAGNSNSCWGVLCSLYSRCRDGSEQPSDSALTRCLQSMVQLQHLRQRPIYLLIDALDECPNTHGTPSAREKVLKFLKDLVSLKQSNLFICITSRPEQDIRTVLDHLTPPPSRVPLHEEHGQTDDINSYIRYFVEMYCDVGWRKEDKELVIEVLSNRAHGMFQWVFFQLDTLRRCRCADLHKTLNELPTNLDVTYERALQRVPEQQREYAYRIFQCLLVALRPLRVRELAEVFKVKFGNSGDTAPDLMEDCRPENSEKAVLSACSTLVTIVGSEDSRIVQFSHFSVKEFLTSNRLRTHGVENIRHYYIPLDLAHSLLARVCLAVLLRFDKNVDKGLLEKFPLALYAGQNWVDHAKVKDVASQIQDLMKSLFTPSKPYLAAWVWIHDVDMGQIQESTSTLAERPTPPKATALYYAVLCGFSVLAKYLIDKHGEDVNAKCGRHGSPLHAASYEGHLEAVRVLLHRHADPNTEDQYKRTPLYVAFDLKRYKVMRLLLQHRADPNMSYDPDQRLLHRVSDLGDAGVGRLLLKHNADVNARDSADRTPLHCASKSGHQKVVKLLLESRANVNARSETQMTPLHLASEHGHLDVVSLLLASGADVNASSMTQTIPLHLASEHGHLEVVRFLLASGVNVNASSMTQMTPLHFASEHGNPEVVRLLLVSGADVNASSTTQTIPLHLASEHGHLEVVRLLLASGANVNAPSMTQMTPLHFASEHGNPEVIRLLLVSGADVNASSTTQTTPLHLASKHGHLEVVRLLVSGANVNASSIAQMTPLHFASEYGNPEVVRLLLVSGADVNASSTTQTIPLHLASKHGHLEVVRLLVSGANVNASSTAQMTPLHVASEYGNPEVVRLLLVSGADVNASSMTKTIPLHLASKHGHLEVVRLLLASGANVNASSIAQMTPLHFASKYGNPEVVRLILVSGADVNVSSTTQTVPLHLASKHGHLEVVRLLLESGANVNASSVTQMTPLHFSSEHVLESQANVSAQSKAQMTPLHLASEHGHPEVVSLLLKSGANSNALSYPQLPDLHLPFGLTGEFYGPRMPVPEPFSLCTGKRRALIIGIDYTLHPDPYLRLEWCAEDAFTMANFLCDKLGFKPDDIRIITDKNPRDLPTKENILDAMRALVRDAKPHDSFFLYFSGHGTQVKDMNGDERDGLGECICAVDWRGNRQPPYEDMAGLIIDDVMHDILVKPLPLQCRLTTFFDGCHSETLLDLPYVYSSRGVVKEIKHVNKLGLLREKSSYADVVSLSASKDSRGAEETRKGGALRLAFINCLTSFEYNVTYNELIKSVREYMRNNRLKQKPVLSSSYEIDTDSLFVV